MITVPARRVKQFGVEFYQAGLSAKDIDRLVKFEVLGYAAGDMSEDAKAKARKNAAARSSTISASCRARTRSTCSTRPRRPRRHRSQ